MIVLTVLSLITLTSARTTTSTRHLPTAINSKSIRKIIHSEKRFTLYNSRRLTGECLPICHDLTPSPMIVADPTPSPTIGIEVKTVVTDEAREECVCETGDESKQSFKCGNDVYVCPGITEVCSTTGSQNSLYYKITQVQCNAMRLLNINDDCLALGQYGMKKGKGLSNRVCYDGSVNGMKVDAQGCDVCTGKFEPNWETPDRRYR